MLILANDGIHPEGKRLLEEAGFRVQTEKVAQDRLATFMKENEVVGVLVRSATQITAKELGAWDGLKVIGRAGVGLDNIDLKTAEANGIKVVNTPAASSQSVAELVLAHLFSVSRFLQLSNREMPVSGTTDFAKLKKSYSKGSELQGKTLGIVGIGRIGQALAKMALGLGMKVVAHDPFIQEVEIAFHIHIYGEVNVTLKTVSLDELLQQSDVISFHVPKPKDGAMVASAEFEKMKDGVMLINAARGGVIDEVSLLHALDSGKVLAAGLDVFENEPTPKPELLEHPRVSITPHIGASTNEAQARIGIELAEKVIEAVG
ncbi:MAG: 3-phosphoglycerate dehydrogenase [Flavobacteriales bacterium]|nr:3-phosphoglycerate dehydrogenase [Flavobacteriales bacterium]